jgi:hypothetical protein
MSRRISEISNPNEMLVWEMRQRQVDAALAPLDRLAREMEGAWGYRRLQSLASPDLAVKFESARQKLDEAIKAQDADAVAKRAEILMRGWQALAKAAGEQGHAPLGEGIWQAKSGGRTYTVVLVREDADAPALSAAEPETVVCVEELLVCWQNRYESTGVAKAKDAFPGASVVDERPRTGKALPRGGDEIPF